MSYTFRYQSNVPHQQAAYERAQRPTVIDVQMQRRDGKYVVLYCFHGSGRRITKLMTLAQVHAEIAAHPRYAVTGVRIPPVPVAPADAGLAAFMAEATGESNY